MTALAPGDAMVAEWAATKTVLRLFHHLDARDYAAAAALFAPDGWWLRLGRRLVGPSEVAAALAERPATLVTRHLVTNLIADADATGVDVRYTITVFDGSADDAGPCALDALGAVFAAEDRLVDMDGAPRFASRAPRLVFKRG